MISRDVIRAQLQHVVNSVECPELGKKLEGKVRDSYVLHDKNPKQRVIITTDRLSAFDRVLTTIPFKGQLLNQMAAHWFKATEDIIPNHIIDIPHPNVLVAREVSMLPVEVIVRGYLTGSAWRDYTAGNDISGITLPAGMKKSQRFEVPLLTPSTKAEMGEHDLPISSAEIVSSGLVEKKLWEEVSEKALALFALGSKKANENGLILVDTKYEFGTITDNNGKTQLVLADEIHTQDSSRYWKLPSYQQRFESSEDPEMLDKEFVRRWLMETHNYMGEGEQPHFDDEIRIDIAARYIEVFEMITGIEFKEEAGEKTDSLLAVLRHL